MKKNILYIIIILILISTLFLICEFLHSIIGIDSKMGLNATVAQQTETLYYKDIDVTVKDIKQTWNSNKEQVWSVTVSSDEYGLDEIFQVSLNAMHSSAYADDIYRGNLKTGSVIRCEMLSWCVGDKVTRRKLNQLVDR